MKKIKLILNESLISNKDSDIIEDTSIQQQPDYQIVDITVIPDEDYYPTIQAILIDLDENNKLVESDGNRLDINILSETVNQKTGYSNTLFEFESKNHTITLSLVLQETEKRGIYKVEAYTTRGIKVFESNTYKPKHVIESYLNSLANEYLIDKPLKEAEDPIIDDVKEDLAIEPGSDEEAQLDEFNLRNLDDWIETLGEEGLDRNEIFDHLTIMNNVPEDYGISEEELKNKINSIIKYADAKDKPYEDAPSETPNDYSVEEFMRALALNDEVMNLDIDYSEWNNLGEEERFDLVRPEIEKFISKHKNEFDKDSKLFDLLQYNLIDNNFHTEAKVLRDLYRGGE